MTTNDPNDTDIAQRLVTSSKLSKSKVGACWVLGILLTASGITATFTGHDGAGAATMIVFGGLLLALALMERVPLKFEVAGAKLDATYERDRAFEAGREGGVAKGLDTAIGEVEAAIEAGEASPDALLERLRDEREVHGGWASARGMLFDEGASLDAIEANRVGYRGPAACAAVAITYKQLDYWYRTGVVLPSAQALNDPKQRLYTFKDVVLLKVTKRLLDAGFPLSQVRFAIAHLREQKLDEIAACTIMGDGEAIYFSISADETRDLVATGKAAFGIALGRLVDEVEAALRELPAQPTAGS
ncbi:MerR family transcriptional regulator [Kribbella sp. NPDC058245]|uniref:MerR family transcriptional regulator n=1 Tax=Kribbella sp. NPDC058245 TaxID=3346399 RepID=UPI0036EB9748